MYFNNYYSLTSILTQTLKLVDNFNNSFRIKGTSQLVDEKGKFRCFQTSKQNHSRDKTIHRCFIKGMGLPSRDKKQDLLKH